MIPLTEPLDDGGLRRKSRNGSFAFLPEDLTGRRGFGPEANHCFTLSATAGIVAMSGEADWATALRYRVRQSGSAAEGDGAFVAGEVGCCFGCRTCFASTGEGRRGCVEGRTAPVLKRMGKSVSAAGRGPALSTTEVLLREEFGASAALTTLAVRFGTIER